MTRPKFFRDPIHGQIKFDSIPLDKPPPKDRSLASWIVRKLIECREFQRLRHIRQNGLVNLVFHGAEHSRFTHSIGVAHLARVMLHCIERDARHAGLEGYDFDLPRLLDCLEHLDNKRIAVNRRANAAVELYLVALDKLYSSVYYHHTIRAATVLLGSILRRAAFFS